MQHSPDSTDLASQLKVAKETIIDQKEMILRMRREFEEEHRKHLDLKIKAREAKDEIRILKLYLKEAAAK